MNENIVIIMSDQHSGVNLNALTPNLDKIKLNSHVFNNAYCNNPLCVPSRMSFLTAKESNEICIYDNDGYLKDNEKTIAHHMKNSGYRTILVGRMHFKGDNQLHGFSERYVGDITTKYWGTKRSDLKYLTDTNKVSGCQKYVGYGDSFVQEFDEAVYKKSVEILSEYSEQPIFMVVGFYGPHFPYICKENYFKNYINIDLDLNNYFMSSDDSYKNILQKSTSETLFNIRCSYYGLIEILDEYIGEIHKTFRKNKKGIFIYTSDHGDMLGKRRLFGKKVLYQESIKVPLIIEYDEQDHKVFNHSVSLIDLNNHLVKMYCYKNECKDTILYDDHHIIRVQTIIEGKILNCVINNKYKLIDYGSDIKLYDLKDNEINNSYIINELKKYLLTDYDKQKILHSLNIHKKDIDEKKIYYEINDFVDDTLFKISNKSIQIPRRRKYEI